MVEYPHGGACCLGVMRSLIELRYGRGMGESMPIRLVKDHRDILFADRGEVIAIRGNPRPRYWPPVRRTVLVNGKDVLAVFYLLPDDTGNNVRSRILGVRHGARDGRVDNARRAGGSRLLVIDLHLIMRHVITGSSKDVVMFLQHIKHHERLYFECLDRRSHGSEPMLLRSSSTYQRIH